MQILEVFKNTLATKLYWILFPKEDLRQAVDIAKNTYQRKIRQTIDRSNFHQPIYEYQRKDR